MVNLSLVEGEAVKKDFIEMLSKHKNLRSARLGAITDTHHTIDLREGPRPIRQQTYCARQRSRERLRELIDKQWEDNVF